MAVCTDNITDVTTKEMESEADDGSNFVKTFVCQSTIIPSDSKGFRTALSSQSVSLADAFLGNTHIKWHALSSVRVVLYPALYEKCHTLCFLCFFLWLNVSLKSIGKCETNYKQCFFLMTHTK